VPHELQQSAHLGPRDRLPEARDPVISPTLVIGARASLLHLDDQPLLDHARHCAIERARAEPQLAVGARLDVLHDRVAVTVGFRQRQQDVERGRREREQLVGRRVAGHGVVLQGRG